MWNREHMEGKRNVGNLKEEDHLENVDLDGTII
jgi:hypothetical protein